MLTEKQLEMLRAVEAAIEQEIEAAKPPPPPEDRPEGFE